MVAGVTARLASVAHCHYGWQNCWIQRALMELTPGVESVGGLGMAVKVVFDVRERREAHWRGLRAGAGVGIEDVTGIFRHLAILAT